MWKIYKYIILSSILFWSFTALAQSQDASPKQKKEEDISIATKDSTKLKMIKNISLEVDVAPTIATLLIDHNRYSVQANVQMNLMNRYFPVVEIGMGGADRKGNKDIHFSTNGFFGKIGLDYNILKPKSENIILNNYAFVGVRLGVAPFKYSIENIEITDPYWGGKKSINHNSTTNVKAWFELVAGVKAQVYKNLYMGWSVRNKRLITTENDGEFSPWYIPGYGVNSDNSIWTLSYIVGLKF